MTTGIVPRKRKTTEEFIRDALVKHGERYDYSRVIYVLNSDKVEIVCPTHGLFYQSPNHHLCGKGCPGCARADTVKNLIPISALTTDDFRRRASIIHAGRYDYARVECNGNKNPIEIVCPDHGSFWQSPNAHLRGTGCPPCGLTRVMDRLRSTVDMFIKIARQVHGEVYDYSRVDYKGNKTKVEIVCLRHGSFFQKPNNHLGGNRCPQCLFSIGEAKVAEILDKNCVSYIKQKAFPGLVYRASLRFDFYLPERNVCIEYQGLQHFKSSSFFGGDKALSELLHRDQIKRDWCRTNDIVLIDIPYTTKDIESFLLAALFL